MRKLLAAIIGLALSVGGLLAATQSVLADTAGRPDDPTPDDIYYEVEGPSYAEDKDLGLMGGGAPGSGGVIKSTTVGVGTQAGAEALGGGAMAQGAVTFPYVRNNWTIYSWYQTNDGLRFYGAYFKSEQILYDYRTPWIKANGVKFSLTPNQRIAGPDLWEYTNLFLVKIKYNLGNPNIDVTVVTRFYSNGLMEPWVLVDGKGVSYQFVVPERFDFDLGGYDDDNQQYYNGTLWRYSTTEHMTLDADYGENPNGYQWRTFDTDQQGAGFIYDQEIDVTPYHPDAPRWYHLAYAGGEWAADPAGCQNNQLINQYVGAQPDPWVGYDAVNWYVSIYSFTALAYPGPWIRAVV